MSLRYPDQSNYTCFFVTTSFKGWKKYGNIPGVYEGLADSLGHCLEKYEAYLSGYAFMPSHLHLLLFIDGEKVSAFMRDFKKYISQKIMKQLGINAKQIWMSRFDRVVIVSENIFRRKLNYIHNNPVKAGLVKFPENWEWSSAKDYFTDKNGKVKIWKNW